jgi:hypothetical protein
MKRKCLAVGIVFLFVQIAYSPVIRGCDDAGAALSVIETEHNKKIISYEPNLFDWGVDQENTLNSGLGITLHPPEKHAQSFTPTKDKLTAVSLYLFQGVTPPDPVRITVSIRDTLTGSDLVTTTLNTSEVAITKSGQWVLFDFEDISINPENTYYIVCSVDAGSPSHAYCWLFANNDIYPRGKAWFQASENDSWTTWPSGSMYPVDFCFKTYFRKPLDSSVLKDNEHLLTPWLGSILERLPHAFPFLRQLLVTD